MHAIYTVDADKANVGDIICDFCRDNCVRYQKLWHGSHAHFDCQLVGNTRDVSLRLHNFLYVDIRSNIQHLALVTPCSLICCTAGPCTDARISGMDEGSTGGAVGACLWQRGPTHVALSVRQSPTPHRRPRYNSLAHCTIAASDVLLNKPAKLPRIRCHDTQIANSISSRSGVADTVRRMTTRT